MAEPVIYIVGFVYSLVYTIPGSRDLVLEGELLSFNDEMIEIKGPKAPVVVQLSWISQISRKG